VEAPNPAASRWKSPNCNLWRNLEHKLDSNQWQASKVFGQAIQRLRGKTSHTARSIKDWNGVLLSNDEDSIGSWREYFKDNLNPITIAVSDAEEVHYGGKFHHCSRSFLSCRSTEGCRLCWNQKWNAQILNQAVIWQTRVWQVVRYFENAPKD